MSSKKKELYNFTEKMCSLMESKINLKDSINIYSQIYEKKLNPIKKVYEELKKGISLPEALSTSKDFFPDWYIQFIKLGWATGNIFEIFIQLKEFMDNKKSINKKISSAIIYPLFIIFSIIILLFIASIFIVPKFNLIFEELGNQVLQEKSKENFYITIIILTIILLIIAGVIKKMHKEKRHFILLKIPVIGKYFLTLELLNFSFAMETGIKGNLSMEKSLSICQYIIKNEYIKNKIKSARKKIMQGTEISTAFEEENFPEEYVKWLKIAEVSQTLNSVFSTTKKYYKEQLEKQMDLFTKLIEPSVTLLTGLVLLFAVQKYILPLLDLYSNIIQ